MIRHIFETLLAKQKIYNDRAALKRMSDHLLNDIGLSRAEASDAFLKPIWDAPETWKAPERTGRLPRPASIY